MEAGRGPLLREDERMKKQEERGQVSRRGRDEIKSRVDGRASHRRPVALRFGGHGGDLSVSRRRSFAEGATRVGLKYLIIVDGVKPPEDGKRAAHPDTDALSMRSFTFAIFLCRLIAWQCRELRNVSLF